MGYRREIYIYGRERVYSNKLHNRKRGEEDEGRRQNVFGPPFSGDVDGK